MKAHKKLFNQVMKICYFLFATGQMFLLATSVPAQTSFKAVFCLGYSWTDTQRLYPDNTPDFTHNSTEYWQNRTANGPMWAEFVSTNLVLVYQSSNNYARGAAASVHVLSQATGLSAGPTPGLNLYE